MNKRTGLSLMKKHNIEGEVSGAGTSFRVELADTATMERFCALVVNLGGVKYADGSWGLSSTYIDRGDPCDPTSAHHY
jgi:hypothetical protein